MQRSRFYFFILVILLMTFGYLTYMIIKPFLTPIMWAVVMTILFYPVYLFIRKYIKWETAASIITLCLILALITGPFSYLVFTLGTEVRQVSGYFEQDKLNTLVDKIGKAPALAWVMGKAETYFGFEMSDVGNLLQRSFSLIGKNMINWVSSSLVNVASVVLDFALMLFSLYFLLKDGPDLIIRLREYAPFSEPQKERLSSRIRDMIISTIYGGVTVAICQGILGGLAFLALGISSPVLWGFLISVTSFIPMVGTMAVWGPAAVFLLIEGAFVKGIIMVLVGVFVIGMIDNILKPILIGGRTKMHTLVIFFSVLGGINFFGLIGLIMGPLVVVIFLSIFEIFRFSEVEVPAEEEASALRE